jgi:hypothetical protein
MKVGSINRVAAIVPEDDDAPAGTINRHTVLFIHFVPCGHIPNILCTEYTSPNINNPAGETPGSSGGGGGGGGGKRGGGKRALKAGVRKIQVAQKGGVQFMGGGGGGGGGGAGGRFAMLHRMVATIKGGYNHVKYILGLHTGEDTAGGLPSGAAHKRLVHPHFKGVLPGTLIN